MNDELQRKVPAVSFSAASSQTFTGIFAEGLFKAHRQSVEVWDLVAEKLTAGTFFPAMSRLPATCGMAIQIASAISKGLEADS